MANASIDKLNIEIQASASRANKELDKTISSLERFGTALKGLRSGSTAGFIAELDKLSNAASKVGDMQGFNKLSSSLSSLSRGLNGVSKVNVGNFSNQLSQLSNATKNLNINPESGETMKKFASGIRSMSTASKNLNALDYDSLAKNILQLTNAIKPLTDEMIRGGAAATNYGTQLKETVQAAKMANKVKQSSAGGFYQSGKLTFQLTNIMAAFYALQRVGTAIGGAVQNINSYVENVNLFTVAMGEYAQDAEQFANTLESRLGVNSGESMRYLGFFQQLETSFGANSEQAYKLSKNLTQLGYDLASFYNLNTDEAFMKLQSGLAGKIFCLVCKGLHTVTHLNGETLVVA